MAKRSRTEIERDYRAETLRWLADTERTLRTMVNTARNPSQIQEFLISATFNLATSYYIYGYESYGVEEISRNRAENFVMIGFDVYRERLGAFAKDIAGGRYLIKADDWDKIRKRLKDVVKSAYSFMVRGWVAALAPLELVDWVLGIAEHCEDCIALANGSPYALNYATSIATGRPILPTVPRAWATVCGGNCQCTLQTRSGRLPIPAMPV